MKKQFTISKIGYTVGIYGCSNEYFKAIVIGKEIKSFLFSGMYGAENTIAKVLRNKGYEEIYTPSIFGKMTRKDIPNNMVVSEDDAVKFVIKSY